MHGNILNQLKLYALIRCRVVIKTIELSDNNHSFACMEEIKETIIIIETCYEFFLWGADTENNVFVYRNNFSLYPIVIQFVNNTY